MTTVGLAGARPAPIALLGLPLDPYTPGELIDRLVCDSQAGRGGYVVTLNVEQLRSTSIDPRLRMLAQRAEIRVADGVPLLWACRLRGTPLPERVAGADLIVPLTLRLADAGCSLYLLGGNPGTAEAAAIALLGRAPELRIVGTYFPPHGFEHDPDEVSRIRAAVVDAQPDFVYLGLPFARATELAAELREVLPTTWFLGLGYSFSFVSGEARRAPAWMRRAGLEWTHRLAHEPRRLWRRYLLEGVPFALRLLAASARERRAVHVEAGELLPEGVGRDCP
jgi:N-acetylglucosaminyldiphosphoundecaprenol N-acetyl-beta-D-mannosaminyltransferase